VRRSVFNVPDIAAAVSASIGVSSRKTPPSTTAIGAPSR